ncbi:MAG: phosphatase PAP2 family protein [Bacteroidetes bacterium]|nr:phosphatase PAP2 family protein [Bacteroidota bacterium]
MKTKLASFISVIGHPLLTLPVFSIIAFFTYEEFHSALLHSSLIAVGISLPLALKMYLNSKNGKYSNFDVSNKTQRQSWYVFAIIVLLIVTIILFVTGQPRTINLSVLFSLILLSTSKITNYFVKSSLHVSLNVFLSFLLLPMNLVLGLLFLLFTILIAWSRLILKRHTFKEIIAGFIIGLTVGTFALYCIG